VGVTIVQLPHDFVDGELEATTDVEPLDPEIGGDVQAIDEGLVLCHIVGRTKVQSNNVEESISLGGISTAPRAPLRVKELSKYILQCS
jgi:hypothetical protein